MQFQRIARRDKKAFFSEQCLIKPPYDPAISLLGIYPEETKTEKDTCILFFIAALFTIARTWKQPRRPLTDEWIKVWYIYSMQLLLSHKKVRI